jgi:hypothetical protein
MRAIKHQILVFLLVGLGSTTAIACQPVILSHYKYFRKAKAVFIGKVLDVQPNDAEDPDERKYYPYKIKFSVEKIWKGDNTEITIVSDNGSGACDQLKFKTGEKYLVYAFGKNLAVTTYVGNRSRPLNLKRDWTEKELDELNSFWFRLKSKLWLF